MFAGPVLVRGFLSDEVDTELLEGPTWQPDQPLKIAPSFQPTLRSEKESSGR